MATASPANADFTGWGAPLPRPERQALLAAARLAPVFLVSAGACAFLPQLIQGGGSVATTSARLLAALVAAALMDCAYALVVYVDTAKLRRLLAAALAGAEDYEPPGLVPDEVLSSLTLVVRGLRQRAGVAETRSEEQRRLSEASAAGVMELVTAIVEGEERIRGQIVADLHDSVAQNLLVAIYRADELVDAVVELPTQVGGGPVVEGRVKEVVEELEAADLPADLRTAEQSLRDVMKDARPPELSRGDLGTALTGLAAELQRRHGLEVSLLWPAEPLALPTAWATTVYRFCQEALRNVAKHAGVPPAEVRFRTTGAAVTVEVTDNGVGFAQAAPESPTGHHVGLALMALRAHALGGRCETRSAPGHGTQVSLTLPLPVTRR